MNIQELRIEIDKIDNKIIDLLNKRMNYVNQVGDIKKKIMNLSIDLKEKKKLLTDYLIIQMVSLPTRLLNLSFKRFLPLQEI